jgi:hypothetical protein
MVAASRHSVSEELEEQRCIIEGQQVEIRRQQHQIETQRSRMDYMEAELAAIKGTLQRTTSPLTSRAQRSPNHGNGNGNRSAHHAALQLANDTISSADAT